MHLNAVIYGAAQTSAKLLLVMAIFVPLERLFAARPKKLLRRAFFTDLGYYFIGSMIPKLLLIVPLSALAWAAHRAVPGGLYALTAQLPVGLRLLAALIVGEIGYYWGHRLMHEVPALWRFHVIHHSAEDMDWLINTRAHPLDVVFGRLCGLVPIYMLGLAQPMAGRLDVVPLLFALLGSLWGFFVHANVNWRFGPIEWIVTTPAFHHWHHTNDGPELIDKNYAAMLPWIDRLFGTHYLPQNLPRTYGISGAVPEALALQLLSPLRLARFPADRPHSEREGALDALAG
jgi:sterol desaturase/sphingolipid hydroxylase (fatty acid hydroxylase superfamily)